MAASDSQESTVCAGRRSREDWMILVKRFALAMMMSFCSEGAIAQEMVQPVSHHQMTVIQDLGVSAKPAEIAPHDCR